MKGIMAGVEGIEPSFAGPEPAGLPLTYTPITVTSTFHRCDQDLVPSSDIFRGGSAENRTRPCRLRAGCSALELQTQSVRSCYFEGPSPMTVRTTNLAFPYLFLDATPRTSQREHPSNVVSFHTPNMIKLQNHRIGLPTVHTGVLGEVFKHPVLVGLLHSPLDFRTSCLVLLTVIGVVGPPSLTRALLAV